MNIKKTAETSRLYRYFLILITVHMNSWKLEMTKEYIKIGGLFSCVFDEFLHFSLCNMAYKFYKMQIIIHQLNGRVHILSAIRLLKLLQLPHFTSFVGNKCSNLRLSTVISSYNVRRNNEKMKKFTNRMLERITVYKSNIDIVHILHTKWPAFYWRNFKITFRNGSYHFILTGH